MFESFECFGSFELLGSYCNINLVSVLAFFKKKLFRKKPTKIVAKEDKRNENFRLYFVAICDEMIVAIHGNLPQNETSLYCS